MGNSITEQDSADKKELLKYLQAEIKKGLERIHVLQITELSFVTGLFTITSIEKIGSIKIPPELFLIIPLIAIAFEVFVINERGRIDRAGDFIAYDEIFKNTAVNKWEQYVNKRPIMYEANAHLLINILLIMAASALFTKIKGNSGFIHDKWYVGLSSAFIILIIYPAHFCIRCPNNNSNIGFWNCLETSSKNILLGEKKIKYGFICCITNLLNSIFSHFAPYANNKDNFKGSTK